MKKKFTLSILRRDALDAHQQKHLAQEQFLMAPPKDSSAVRAVIGGNQQEQKSKGYL